MEEIQDEKLSVKDLFLESQETYEEAQQRAYEESKAFSKAEFFRMEKFGTYRFRILPIAPNPDKSPTRKGYEYPVRQILMEIEKPGNSEKKNCLYVSVPRAIDAGHSVDVIETYRKIAIKEANEKNDEKLAEKINGGSFGGGLKYSYDHVLYILDLNERAKGCQLLTLSHSQYKGLEDRKNKLWQKKLQKNPTYPCPISSVYNAYPVEVEKKKNGSKTEYIFSIDNESDNDALTIEELNALMSSPRIPEVVYRYSRYQFEATLEFLKQCDAKYGLNVLENEEVKEVIETLKNELPKEDTSSFSFDRRSKDNKENSETSLISLDELYDCLDQLKEKGLSDKTEEGIELRNRIRAFIEQEKLNIRVTRSMSNSELLDKLQELIDLQTTDDLPF